MLVVVLTKIAINLVFQNWNWIETKNILVELLELLKHWININKLGLHQGTNVSPSVKL